MSSHSDDSVMSTVEDAAVTDEELIEIDRGYIDMERQAHLDAHEDAIPIPQPTTAAHKPEKERQSSLKERDEQAGRVVDVVLSDMSAPWDQTTGFWQRSVTEPYHRMQNTSGIAFKDHAGSMVRVPVLFSCLFSAGVAGLCLDSRETNGTTLIGPVYGSLDVLLRHITNGRAFRV
jgi:hypothetical protein